MKNGRGGSVTLRKSSSNGSIGKESLRASGREDKVMKSSGSLLRERKGGDTLHPPVFVERRRPAPKNHSFRTEGGETREHGGG